MTRSTMNGIRALAVALALTLGLVGATGGGSLQPSYVAAQEEVTDPVTEEDEGFDDWGLLGLLGLAGLAGLLKRPARQVVVDDPARRTH